MNGLSRTTQCVCFIVASFWTTLVSAQCVGGQCTIGPPPAAVRVVHTLGPCRNYGSGTIVHDDGQRAVVLSCAHLFREGTGQVHVHLRDGRTLAAIPKAVDMTWDLSALEIDSPGIAPIDLAAAVPLPGQRLQSCGFGPNGVYQCNTGTVQGYTRASNTQTSETLCLTGSARDGDSGGPVLNLQGELVGVLWGTDGRTVHATYCGRIRKFLAGLLPNRAIVQTPPPQTPATNPPLLSPPNQPSTDQLDAITKQLEQATQKQTERDSQLASRMNRIESVLGALDTLRDRLAPSEPVPPSPELPSPARQAVADAAANSLSSLLISALPGVLTALGWTTPPSLAAILALRLGLALLRRRMKRKRASTRGARDSPAALKPLNDQYAAQLNEVYALAGRSPTADATLGREYDRELREMETAADDTLARWAHNLRHRVAGRFLRIHDESPLPAEPIAKTG